MIATTTIISGSILALLLAIKKRMKTQKKLKEANLEFDKALESNSDATPAIDALIDAVTDDAAANADVENCLR